MSESYIGLAPSYGVFEKQVIAGTTATGYVLDFDVVQATQLLVSLDGIVQEPDYAYSVGRDASGNMQLSFTSALTVTAESGRTIGVTSDTITVANSGVYNIGQSVSNANIPANTFIISIPNGTSIKLSNKSTNTSSASSQTINIGSRIFVTYLGKQLLTPSANNANTYPKLETFTGDGSDVTFDLTTTPPSAAGIMVFVDGVFQREGSDKAWTLGGSTITFTGTPANSANIAVMHLATEQSFLPTVADATVTNAKLSLSNSSATTKPTVNTNFAAATLTIKAAPTGKTYNEDDLLVYVNGLCLVPKDASANNDYTVSGTTLTLVGGAPAAGSSIVVRYLPK